MTRPQLEVFFDGDCPLCRREIAWLRRRDRDERRVVFVDIAASDFDAGAYGKTHEEFMGLLHARRDGEWVIGVEVFRQMYEAVGLGFLVRWTRWPVLRSITKLAYTVFARNRLRFRQTKCKEGSCQVQS